MCGGASHTLDLLSPASVLTDSPSPCLPVSPSHTITPGLCRPRAIGKPVPSPCGAQAGSVAFSNAFARSWRQTNDKEKLLHPPAKQEAADAAAQPRRIDTVSPSRWTNGDYSEDERYKEMNNWPGTSGWLHQCSTMQSPWGRVVGRGKPCRLWSTQTLGLQ